MPEFWIPMGFVKPEDMAARARQVEADGWDGIKIFDTQCMFGDAFVMATAAATATSRLGIAFATSNPITRHPCVAASALAALAAIAGPRVWYGIGRGDSALAYVGGAPAPMKVFERYLAAVRTYLHGGAVPFADMTEWRITRDVSTIELGDAPAASMLKWLDPKKAPVPIEVFATGPKALAVAGRYGDRVALGLGGDLKRLKWGMEIARAARAEAGLDPKALSFSSVVPVGVSPDAGRARASVAGMVASSARFAVINGPIVGPVEDWQRPIYEAIGAAYDMNHHGQDGAQTQVLTDDFIDAYAIVGSPQRCIDRICELVEIGVDSLMLAPPQGDLDPAMLKEGYELLTQTVIPGVRNAFKEPAHV